MSKTFIACGHGGGDPGAIGSGTNERELSTQIMDEAEKILKTQKPEKRLVRVPDKYALIKEVAWINRNISSTAHDIAIDFHFNSNAGTPATGTETYYDQAGAKPLAKEVNEEVVKVLKLRNRGVKWNGAFYFNNVVRCASCILEMGFINNPSDVKRIREKGGLALAKAIVRASNGTWAPTPQPKPKKPVETPTEPKKPAEVPKEVEKPEKVTKKEKIMDKVKLPDPLKGYKTYVGTLLTALGAFGVPEMIGGDEKFYATANLVLVLVGLGLTAYGRFMASKR